MNFLRQYSISTRIGLVFATVAFLYTTVIFIKVLPCAVVSPGFCIIFFLAYALPGSLVALFVGQIFGAFIPALDTTSSLFLIAFLVNVSLAYAIGVLLGKAIMYFNRHKKAEIEV